MFGKKVIAVLTFAQKMRTDEFEIFIVYMDLSDRYLVFQAAVCVFPGHRVVTGFIQYIGSTLTLIIREAVG